MVKGEWINSKRKPFISNDENLDKAVENFLNEHPDAEVGSISDSFIWIKVGNERVIMFEE